MLLKITAKISLCILFLGFPLLAQTATPTKELTRIQKYNPLRVDGGIFEQRLFQADALLRMGDAITTQRTVFDGTGRFEEKDPIAPGENHSVWMAYGFQLGAHVAIVQGHNFLVRHHHTKLARSLVIADIAVEAYTVGMNARVEANGKSPVIPTIPSSPIPYKPVYR